jgi:hypothetical protein
MIEVDVDAGRPSPLAQRVASDNFARAIEQRAQDLIGLFLQADAPPVAPDFMRLVVKFTLAKAAAVPSPSCRIHMNFVAARHFIVSMDFVSSWREV